MAASVSIITPVFNASKCIGNYLHSIMAQTCGSIEVIIVDDRSTDDTISKARSVTDIYDGPITFRYFTTEKNSGPGLARNIGINAATGKYIAFVDCDDLINSRFCEIMVRSAEHNSSDVCCCNLELGDMAGNVTDTRRHPKVGNGEFTGKRRRKFLSRYVTYLWTFLFRRQMLVENDIHFPPTRFSEDSVMLCCALLRCRRFSQVDECLYRYIRTAGSLTISKNDNRYLQKLSSLRVLMDLVKTRGWYYPEKEIIDFIYIKKGYLVSVVDYVATCDKPDSDVLNDIRQEIITVLPDYRQCPYFKSDFKLQLLEAAVRNTPKLAVLMIRIYFRNNPNAII